MQESCSSKRINDEHNYTLCLSEARQKLENELRRKEITIKSLRKEFATYKRRCIRQGSSISKLKLTLSSVKQKALVSEHLLQAFKNNLSGIMLEIVCRASGDQNIEYSEALKRFALNVYFYSPAAYRYLRSSFNKCLPHVNVLRRWHPTEYVRLIPNTKHELSITVKNQASDTEDQVAVSQDMRDQTILSPKLEYQANLCTEENQAVRSHKLMNQAALFHDTATLSPDLKDQAVKSPDIQDQAIPSYDEDRVLLSPKIQHQPVLSNYIENQETLSSDLDQTVLFHKTEDQAILSHSTADQLLPSHTTEW